MGARIAAVLSLIFSLGAAADLVTFDNPGDLSLFDYANFLGVSAPPPYYTYATGIGGSVGITAAYQGPGALPYAAVYQQPIEINNGVETIGIDFNFPYTSNASYLDRLTLGFTGANNVSLPNNGNGTALLDIWYNPFWQQHPAPNQSAFYTVLAAVDQTDSITNYESPNENLALSNDHWYQATFSETVVAGTATIWGSVSDIGADGTAAPAPIWSTTETDGLSFPASLQNSGWSYGGFETNTAFPMDNFATPEPSAIGFALVALASIGRPRRNQSARGSNATFFH